MKIKVLIELLILLLKAFWNYAQSNEIKIKKIINDWVSPIGIYFVILILVFLFVLGIYCLFWHIL